MAPSMARRFVAGSIPSTVTRPVVGAISPAISRRSVVLPDPLGPRMAIRCSVRWSEMS